MVVVSGWLVGRGGRRGVARFDVVWEDGVTVFGGVEGQRLVLWAWELQLVIQSGLRSSFRCFGLFKLGYR